MFIVQIYSQTATMSVNELLNKLKMFKGSTVTKVGASSLFETTFPIVN